MIKRLSPPDFSRASLKRLIDIRDNNYLGQPRRHKGEWIQHDYPPDELDAVIAEKEAKLDEKGELEHFRQYNELLKQRDALKDLTTAFHNASHTNVVSLEDLNLFLEKYRGKLSELEKF